MTPSDKERLDFLMDKLTMKERAFIEAYFKNDYVGSKAVLEAGYKTTEANARKIAYQILERPNVKEAVSLRAKEKLSEVSISEEFVIRKLIRTVNAAEADNNHGAVLRGLELAARTLGMLRDKTEITGKDGGAIQYEKIEQDAADFVRSINTIAKRSDDTPSLN